jgi:hypothetical protein
LLEERLLLSSFESFTKDKTNSGGKVFDIEVIISLYSFLENEWSRIIETLRLSNMTLAFTSCAETEKAFSNALVHWGLGSPRPTKHSS